jgi:hypothetical protein
VRSPRFTACGVISIPWPDTLAVPNDGNLHVITNQLRRQADYHKGQGRREKPYGVFHVKIDGTPVHLR